MPAVRGGRVFGVVSAIGNVGTVAGALGAAAIWQNVDLGLALLLASMTALAASLTLSLLPGEQELAGNPVAQVSL